MKNLSPFITNFFRLTVKTPASAGTPFKMSQVRVSDWFMLIIDDPRAKSPANSAYKLNKLRAFFFSEISMLRGYIAISPISKRYLSINAVKKIELGFQLPDALIHNLAVDSQFISVSRNNPTHDTVQIGNWVTIDSRIIIIEPIP